MTVHTPRVSFSTWIRWDHLGQFKPPKQPGIYLLAHFKRKPAGRADPCHRRIVYVGETRGQTLRSRLSQFAASASNRRSAHSGGNSYYATFADRKLSHLHVSWLAVPAFGPSGSPHRSRFISYLEQKIIWELTRRHGGRNLLNKYKADKAR